MLSSSYDMDHLVLRAYPFSCHASFFKYFPLGNGHTVIVTPLRARHLDHPPIDNSLRTRQLFHHVWEIDTSCRTCQLDTTRNGHPPAYSPTCHVSISCAAGGGSYGMENAVLRKSSFSMPYHFIWYAKSCAMGVFSCMPHLLI